MDIDNEREPQNINLLDTVCRNRHGYPDPDYSLNINLCAAGKTGVV
jgi:hypothetical protein